MSTCDLLVVGAGPAGHSAATAYRAAGGTGAVVLLAGEGRAPYERPPLSKELLRGELEPEALPLAEHDAFYEEREITVRHDCAGSLHPDEQLVRLRDGAGEIAYERCVLATGAQPVRPPIPGAEQDGVHLLRTVAHRPLHVEHWGDALAQGEVAGWSAAGREASWDAVPGFWSTIGTNTIKYAAWGDGYETARLVDHGDGAFTAWYADAAGACVGVLTHDRDPDYETGQRLIAQGASAP